MKIYLVGGAVRDNFMGVSSKDLDYVVTGSTPEEMKELGYFQVGGGFPVFLRCQGGDEYALARKERKDGKGYMGFMCDFNPEITIEEDLLRRDLTINAIAMDIDGHYVDPTGGMSDIENKVFRHISDDAFIEDAVRVLRIGRFYARFGRDWSVAPETMTLVKSMVNEGALDELTKERVWKEMNRALMENHPRLFFDFLHECGALEVVFPELDKLVTTEENVKWHPEGNSYEHTMLVLDQAVKNVTGYDDELELRMAALFHDLGKGLTDPKDYPKHYGHDVNGSYLIKNLVADRLCVPTKMKESLVKVTRYHMSGHRLKEMNPKTLVKMFTHIRHDKILDLLYALTVADGRGRLGSENEPYDDKDFYNVAWKAFKSVKFDDVFGGKKVTNPEAIKQGMYRAQVSAVAKAKKEFF